MANETPNPVAKFEKALATLGEVFQRLHVKHALIGGVAFAYRSQPRATKDLDLILSVSRRASPSPLQELQRLGFEFDLMDTLREWTRFGMVVLSYQGIRIDWLKPVIPAYAHVLERATEEFWFGQPIRVASAEGLILLKLLAFRPQDQVDIQTLIAAQRDALDVDWIKSEWQTVAILDDPRMQAFLAWVDGNPRRE